MINSMLNLLAQADTTLQDNTSNDITPAEVRDMVKNFIDSVMPGYGAIQGLGITEAVTGVPAVISPFTSSLQATTGFYTTNVAAGQVVRLIQTAGLVGATDFFIVQGNVTGGNNDAVTVELYRNGVATGYAITITARGAARPVGFNVAGLLYTAAPGDATYELRASGDAGNYTFGNLNLLMQAQPVRSYV